MLPNLLDLLRNIRRIGRAIIGRDLFQRRQIAFPTESHGAGYGAWSICPETLSPESIVYSFGVGEDISFDLSLIAQYGMTVHAFDPTPRSIAWLTDKQVPERFRFHAYGVADFDGTATFNAPENPDHVSFSMVSGEQEALRPAKGEVFRLSTIMQKLGHDHIDVLKMDIEGAEYGVIEDLATSGLPVQQLLVEFHHRFEKAGVEKTKAAIRLLNTHGYRIFAVSPRGEEYSFIQINLRHGLR